MTADGGLAPDDQLLQELRSLWRRTEVVPADVVAAAIDAFRWKAVAEAVAELEFDSLLDDDQLARVRDAGGERHLRFVGAGRALEVAVMENNAGLAGRIDPPMPGTVVLRHPDGATLSAPLDEHGQFFFERVKRGPVSLQPVPTDSSVGGFQTEWVTI